MTYKPMPKFEKKNPKNEEEKLIASLIKDLHDVMKIFINLHPSVSEQSLFKILRDSSIGFTGETLDILTNMLAVKKQMPIFLDECKDIFNCYIQQTLENLNGKS
jgi:hypothetical protein